MSEREERDDPSTDRLSLSLSSLILGKRQTENGIPVLSESDEWLGGEGHVKPSLQSESVLVTGS
jgi:hypothetical protein